MTVDRKNFQKRERLFFERFDKWKKGADSVPEIDLLRAPLNTGELSRKKRRYRSLLENNAKSLRRKLDRSIEWDMLVLPTVAKMTDASLYYLFTGKRQALRWAIDALEVLENGVVVPAGDSGTELIECDSLVVAVGMMPVRDLHEALARGGRSFHFIGDCKEPRNIHHAILEGFMVGYCE